MIRWAHLRYIITRQSVRRAVTLLLQGNFRLLFTDIGYTLRNCGQRPMFCFEGVAAAECHAPASQAVSVVIPCYNYGRYLSEAVDARRDQTLAGCEIIIVDDGSTDAQTHLLITHYEKKAQSDSLLRVIRQPNKGLPAARNAGIDVARGIYICCLDADDTLEPTYLEKMLVQLELQADPGFAYSWVRLCGDETGRWMTAPADLRRLLTRNHICVSAVFRKTHWQESGGFNDNMRGGFEDWDFWLCLMGQGCRGYLVPEDLFNHRRHGKTMTHSAIARAPELLAQIRRNHAALYGNPAIIKTIMQGYRYKRAWPAFQNLMAWNAQNSTAKTLLLVMPYMIIGGTERLMAGVVSHLVHEGWRVAVIVTDPVADDYGNTEPWFRQAVSEIYPLPRFLPREVWPEFLDYIITTRNVGVVLNTNSRFLYEQMQRLRSQFPAIRYVFTVFNTEVQAAIYWQYRHISDHVICESAFVRDWFKTKAKDYNIATLHMAPNGVDISLYRPVTERTARMTALLGSDAKKKLVIGFTARMSPEKDPLAVIEIAKRCRDLPDMVFVVAGLGPLADRFQNAVVKAHMQDRIIYAGLVSDVREWIGGCDLTLIPSLRDGRPNVALESLALGVPVLASCVGDFPTLIEEGKTGFLCNPRDYEAFARCLKIFAQLQPQKRNAMKQAARRYAELNLDCEKTWAAYLSALDYGNK